MSEFHQEFFHLPEGAVLEKCLFTTMSMDAATMIEMSALCLRPGQKKIRKTELPTLALEARDKLLFFYDNKHKGSKFKPFTDNFTQTDTLQLFLPLAVGVTKFNAPFFHPKIILLKYSLENSPYFRLLVSSKNLTQSRVFETGVWLESKESEANHNLPDFLIFLGNNTKDEAEDNTKNKPDVDLSAFEAVKDCDFQLNSAEKDVSVTNIQFSGEDLKAIQQTLHTALAADKENNSMVILSPDYETPQDSIDAHQIFKPKDIPTHAKLYYKPDTNSTSGTLWLGSSNCSHGGMEKNIECMVKIANATGITSVSQNPQIVNVFGVNCEQVSLSNISSNSSEDDLSLFIAKHDFELTYSYDENNHLNAKVTITPNATLCPAITLLPAGFSEISSSTTTKWQSLQSGSSSYKFEDAKATPKTGWLRLKLGDVEHQICCNTAIGKALNEALPEKLWDDFAYRPWFDQMIGAKTHQQVQDILKEMGDTAKLLLCTCKDNNHRCAEISYIHAMGEKYDNQRRRR